MNIIERLPRTSAYVEAMTQDVELAEEFLRFKADAKAPQRRMTEWTPETELLSIVGDRLAELIQTVAASAGAKPRHITPLPRPVSAIDRARHSDRIRKHHALVARVLPHKAHKNSGGERPSR